MDQKNGPFHFMGCSIRSLPLRYNLLRDINVYITVIIYTQRSTFSIQSRLEKRQKIVTNNCAGCWNNWRHLL